MEEVLMKSDDSEELEIEKISKRIISIPLKIFSLLLLFTLFVLIAANFYAYFGAYHILIYFIFLLGCYIISRTRKQFNLSHKEIQSWKILSGLFLIILSVFPLYEAISSKQPLIPINIPKEVFELPYICCPLKSENFMVPYKNASTKIINFPLGEFESVNGLWKGDTFVVYLSDSNKTSLKVKNKPNTETWSESIRLNKLETVRPEALVELPISQSQRYNWLNIVGEIEFSYPRSLNEDLKFSSTKNKLTRKINLFVVSDEDINYRIQYDKWKAVSQVQKANVIFSTLFILGFILLLWGMYNLSKTINRRKYRV
jgi:hypothetical protein